MRLENFKFVVKVIKENAFLIPLIPAVLCCLAYLYQILELQHWGISLGMVGSMREQYLAIIIIGILYCFSVTYLQEYLRIQFDLYVPSFLAYGFEKKILKKMCRNTLSKKSFRIKAAITQAKKMSDAHRLDLARTVFWAVMFSAICFFPFYALYFSIVLRTDFGGIIAFFVLTIIVFILIMYWLSGRTMRNEIKKIKKQTKEKKIQNRKKIKNEIKELKMDRKRLGRMVVRAEIKKLRERMGKAKSDLDDALGMIKKIVDIDENRVKTKEKVYNDNNGRLINYFAVVSMTIILFCVSMLSNLYSYRSEYWVYMDNEDNSYVSVFEVGDDLIMKRAEIDGDEANIFLNDQLRIKSTDKVIEYIKFKVVNIHK